MKPTFHNILNLYAYVEGKNWFLESKFSYTTLIPYGFPWKITVPQHFPTNLASVPRILWPFINRNSWTRGAAVIHDWLTYRNNYVNSRGLDSITRADADRIFLEALLITVDNRYKDKSLRLKQIIKAKEVAQCYAMYGSIRAYSEIFKRSPT